MRITHVLAVVMPLLAIAPAAAAAPPEVDAARALREKGDLAGARASLEPLFRKQKSAVVGYELAVTLRALGDLNGAYDVLMQVGELRVASDEELAAQKSAAALLAEIDPLIPMVLVELGDVAPNAVKLFIDGELIPRAQWGEPQPVNPGKHEIVVVLNDGNALKKGFSIKEGARARLSFGGVKQPPSEGEAPPPPEPEPKECPAGQTWSRGECWAKRDYTWQLALAHGAATAVYIGGAAAESIPPFIVGFVGMAFASPVVHWAHGRVGRGFASFGLHMGANLGMLVAAVALNEEPTSGTIIATGLLVGGVAGFGLDWLIVPHHDEVKPGSTPTPMVGIAPIRGGATATLSFVF